MSNVDDVIAVEPFTSLTVAEEAEEVPSDGDIDENEEVGGEDNGDDDDDQETDWEDN